MREYDYNSAKKAEIIRRKKKKNGFSSRRKARINFLGFLFILCIVGLCSMVGYIKYVHGEEYENIAISQQITGLGNSERVIEAHRGDILDRNRQELATSVPLYNAFLDVRKLVLEDDEVREATLNAINEILGIPLGELEGYLAIDPLTQKPVIDRNYYIFAREIQGSQATAIEDIKTTNKKVKYVYIEANTKRAYVQNNLASSVIGFIRGDSKWGLELQYDTELTGESGREFRLYESKNTTVTETNPAREGYTLVSTIDTYIQQVAENAVIKAGEQYNPENASVVIMNPNTGEVLAMAQYGSFSSNFPDNPEYFTNKAYKTSWEAMEQAERLDAMYKTWSNFNISSSFEPGSIFKPIVVSAALEENILSPTDTFYCGGSKHVIDTTLKCWKETGHGNQSLVDALANSCNVAVMEIISELGRDKFYKYRSDFGYGEKTGIDLPGEQAVSSPSVMYTLSALNPVELATSSMGQGFNNTPIQAVNSFAAVINGGNLMKPYVVSHIIDADGNIVKENTPTMQRKVISKETSDYMRLALQSVISPNKTGRNAVIEGYAIGGKTGTAQQGVRDKENGDHVVSFVAYLPVENPEYIAGCFINRPANYVESSVSSAPMMREILLELINYKGIKPSYETSESVNLYSDEASFPLPDFSGKSLKEATRSLNNLELDYAVSGRGSVVVRQHPAPGVMASYDTKVYLYIERNDPDEILATIPNVSGLDASIAADMLTKSGLTPVIFEDMPEDQQEDDNGPVEPVTGRGEALTETVDDEFAAKKVYMQMPEPDLKVEPGIEVKIKVK